jgi:hypothetical protein
MKKIYLLFLICLFYSCTDTGKDLSVTYQVARRISNTSGVDVEITSYFNSLYGNKVQKYTVKNGQEYVENGEFLISEDVGGGRPESDIEWTGSVDSTIVIFNGSKYQHHCSDLAIEGCTVSERSIILGLVSTSGKNRGYELVESQGNYRVYLYKITKEDYENAEDCNGSCD